MQSYTQTMSWQARIKTSKNSSDERWLLIFVALEHTKDYSQQPARTYDLWNSPYQQVAVVWKRTAEDLGLCTYKVEKKHLTTKDFHTSLGHHRQFVANCNWQYVYDSMSDKNLQRNWCCQSLVFRIWQRKEEEVADAKNKEKSLPCNFSMNSKAKILCLQSPSL